MQQKLIEIIKGKSRAKIHYEGYLGEGHMLAMPLGFPGVTVPIDPNDSFITALAAGPNETIYGGTAGRSAHLFVALTRGATGIVVDLGGDGESTECAGIICARRQVVAGMNGKKRARILTRPFDEIALQDCIQEWGFDMSPFKIAAELPAGRRILNMVGCVSNENVIGIMDGGDLFGWRARGNRLYFREGAKMARLAAAAGRIYGVDQSGQLFLIAGDGRSGINLRRTAKISGSFAKNVVWSSAGPRGDMYLADAEGQLFHVAGSGRAVKAGCAPLKPVTCMAVTNDGRLFGFCGRGMANLFVFEKGKSITNLGVAVSVLSRRRAGYEFSSAVAGNDGELYFGEHDRGGHLWVYYPSIKQ